MTQGPIAMKSALRLTAVLCLGLVAAAATAQQSAPQANAPADQKPTSSSSVIEEHYEIPRQKWTYGGLFGYFDQEQLRRGYKVYKNVCANCHNMRFLSYRNLGEPGGPQFSKQEVEALAAEIQVPDGYDEKGEVKMRPGKPSDNFQWRFKNDAEARAALNGALPPDLSLITKARTVERQVAWYAFPLVMLNDLATQYQEQGSDYLYALLTGYSDAPTGVTVAEGLYYDKAFPGHQIAMPQPLIDGAVEYEDKTPNDLDHEARDVTAFMAWAAEPHLVARKKLGIWVLVYLAVLSALLFLSKRRLWRNVEH
jgi:ubiquinol-cytochrome c reductase cytochrome c1 subunit